jgi:hypothetical protein
MKDQGVTMMHDNKEHQCPTIRSKQTTTIHNNEQQHHTTTNNQRMITMHINDKEK